MTDHLKTALDLLETALEELTPMEGLTVGGDDFATWREAAEALLAETRPKPMTIIETFSGVGFDLLSPKPGDVRLKDIAHSLAHLNRFVGHTGKGYSVAEHSLWVWLVVSLEHPDDYALQLEALLHDAQEAYIGDLSGPLKTTLRRSRGVYDGRSPLDDIERGVAQAIRSHFGLHLLRAPHGRIVGRVDQRMRETERRCPVLMPNTRDENWPAGVEPYPEILDGSFGLVPAMMLPEHINDERWPAVCRFPLGAALQDPPSAAQPRVAIPLFEKDIAFLYEHNALRLLELEHNSQRLLELVKGKAP
jgi:hypothetical protein